MKNAYIKAGYDKPKVEEGRFILSQDTIVADGDRAFNKGEWINVSVGSSSQTVVERLRTKLDTICYSREIKGNETLYSEMQDIEGDLERQIEALKSKLEDIKRKRVFTTGQMVVATRNSAAGSFSLGSIYEVHIASETSVRVVANSRGEPDTWTSSNFRPATLEETTKYQKEKLEKKLLGEAEKLGFKVGGMFVSDKYCGVGGNPIEKLLVIHTAQEASSSSGAVLDDWINTKAPFVILKSNCHSIPIASAKAVVAPPAPKVNGYDMVTHTQGNTMVVFGCARISIALLRETSKLCGFTFGGNRSVAGISLNSGVHISPAEIRAILEHVDAVEKNAVCASR